MLALTLVLAASASCPHGDTPRPLGELTAARTEAALHVDDAGLGHLRLTIPIVNATDGPARVGLALPAGAPGVVVTGARLGRGPPARLVDDDGGERFEAFVDALEHGVPTDEVRKGARGPRCG